VARIQKPKRRGRPQQPGKHPRRKDVVTVLVKLHVPDGTWRVIKSQAALAGKTAGAHAVSVLADAATK